MADGVGKSKKMEKRVVSGLPKYYLIAYNLVMFLGWAYLFVIVIRHYLTGGDRSTLWPVVLVPLSIFQNGAVLEILHVAVGLVRSSLMITTFQVFSRVMLVCGVLYAAPTAQVCVGLPIILIAWCISEYVRYLFYIFNLIGDVPYIIVWCRYTFFFVLYPMGVTGELLCFYAAQEYVGKLKQWSVELPNTANFTFSYQYLLFIVMALYIPLFPRMYLYMFGQRRKVIGGETSRKQK